MAVMRRRSDGWLNATQILKVAGVDKGKRTKVLEKEILNGENEKVQGGYGKYQGTWINYRRGVEFCRQYGVEELLRPLLEYDTGQEGTPGMQGMETPTKEQAMAAQRKRMYGGADNRPMTQSSSGTFFKNMSTTAANAVNALNRTRFDSPIRGMDGRRSVGPWRPSPQFPASQESIYGGGSQPSMHSLASQDSFSGSVQNGGSFNYGASFVEFPHSADTQEPPRKRVRPSPQNSFVHQIDPSLDAPMQDGSPTEPNGSFYSQHGQSFQASRDAVFGLEPLPQPNGPLEEQKKDLLLDLFIDPSRVDFSDQPAFLSLSGDDFDIPIDTSCNTALHWAATLARVPLVKQLLRKGANMRRTNSGGETALIAACQARNNLDHNSFPSLLEILGPTIEIRDGRGRTLLHHIAVSSAMKGRAGVGRYYLESLLEVVVRQDSTSSSQEHSSLGSNSQGLKPPNTMSLARFMTEIVNAQDRSGDTALNLAARTSTTSIIDQLIEVGADPHIGNKGGLAPINFGVGNDINNQHYMSQSTQIDNFGNGTSSSQTSFVEAQSEIMKCKSENLCDQISKQFLMCTAMNQLFDDAEREFAGELQEKQQILEQANLALKESGTALAEERHRLEEIQGRFREEEELEQKIANLDRSTAPMRMELAQQNQPTPNGNGVMENVVIGEADKGLDFDGRLAMVEQLFPNGNVDFSGPFTAEQAALISSLERAEVLHGRVWAYDQHNQGLESQAKKLRGMSSELEERYRKIISLCTRVEEDKVDGVLDNLVQAVVSEQKETLELGRVREFLRMVQGQE